MAGMAGRGQWSIEVRRDEWPVAPCGHRHSPSSDRHGFGARAVGTYRLAASFAALSAWDEVRGPLLVTIEAGTLVRCDAWVGLYDPSWDICWDGYRCLILTGPQAGLCVEVADAGTPEGGGGRDWHGDRPTLGLPPVFLREPAAPNDPRVANRP